MKLIYLVLDGAAGDPSLGKTAYMVAEKPNLDRIAKKSKCGLMYTIGKGIPPESDAAVLSLLGYDPEKYYPGRGPIEALGVGLSIIEGKEVAFRGNFATIDPNSYAIIDRRAGRVLSAEEGKELAAALDGMRLKNGYVRVKHTVGHRVVVVIGSDAQMLGDEVGNTDPGYLRKGKISISLKSFESKIAPCTPLTDREEDRRTCELVNEFTRRAVEILDPHPVNLKRKERGLPPANAVLLRDAGGKRPDLPKISSRFGKLRFTSLVEMPVEIGISRASGMDVVELPPPEGKDRKREYEFRAEKTLEALERSDVVYIHLKGPDEPGHDGNLELKASIIEDIDKYYLGRVLERVEADEIAMLITSDHATPCQLKAHSDAPVPFLVYYPNVISDRISSFNEIECRRGSYGIIEKGYYLLPMVLKEIKLI